MSMYTTYDIQITTGNRQQLPTGYNRLKLFVISLWTTDLLREVDLRIIPTHKCTTHLPVIQWVTHLIIK